MDLVTLAPFAAKTFTWTLDSGAKATTVVCKLTFPLEAGTEGKLAAVQEPIVDAQDLVPFKAAADVLVTGFAHAPPGSRVRAIQARLVVGDAVNKTLELTGPRAWLADGRASEPDPVDRVPLVWELTAGGPDTANPGGIPPSDRPPQIVLAGTHLQRGVAVEPAGFGPLAASSPARAERLCGTPVPGPAWHEQPLSWTIDPAFFNVAPPDQRLKTLRSNETILLFGLLADREKFGMRLPGMQPRAFVQAGHEGKEMPLVADTAVVDTERAIVAVTWRGQVPMGIAGERIVVGLHERAGRGVWATFERRLPRGARAMGAAARVHAPAPAGPVLVAAPMPDFIGRRAGVPEPAPEKKPPELAAQAPAPAESRAPRDVLDLLWFEAGLVPKLRANRAWRAVIDQLQVTHSNPGASTKAAADADERNEVFQLLANAEADEPAAIADVLARAISIDGKLVPALALVTGEIVLPFDLCDLLQLTLSAAKPFATADKAFHEVYEAVGAMNEAAALADPVAQGMTLRLREAFQQVKHNLGSRYLETTAERSLLCKRRYQKRDVFGSPHVRALVAGPSGEPVPGYLPADAATRLPLFARFRVRLIAEVNAQMDYEEQNPCALRILAIARVVPRPRAPDPKRN
jgi:hypothetical protein